MISYVNSGLFKKDATKKQLIISYDNKEIRNNMIYFEQFELQEKLCSSENLVFGKCESSELKFKITNEVDSLKDKKLNVSMILNGLTESPFQVGKYRVYSDIVSGNRNYRNIVAYDEMYYILNSDITDWYISQSFPTTIKKLRDSLFSYLGIAQESQALINDNVSIEKTIESTSIKGKDIIPYLCELNGVFGHINRNGNFQYVSLSNSINENISSSDYSSVSYEDFQTGLITGVHIKQEEGDVGASVGTDVNKYVIQGNIFCYGKTSDELVLIAENIFNKIKNIKYVPFSVTKTGNPCLEIGDKVSVSVRNKNIETYVLERKLYGIQMLKDDYNSKGLPDYSWSDVSLDEEIKQLKGKSNVLTRNLEETRSELVNLEEGTSSMIQQTSNSFNASIKSLEDNMKSSDDATNQELESIRKELSLKATSDEIKIEFEKEREAGADKITTSTGYTFNEDGLRIEKSDSEMATSITDDGMKVTRSGEEVLKATSSGVDAVNLHAKTYLIIGMTSRFEDYYNEDGELRTGCFWIGDNPPVEPEEPEITLESISASYSGGSVAVGTSLSSLTGITVTARYSDNSTKNVTGYSLSGSISKVGSNTITVTYEGKTTTFTVTGVSSGGSSGGTTLAITQQPVSKTIALGETTTISVKATGSGLTYQWKVGLPFGTGYYWQDAGNFGAIQ